MAYDDDFSVGDEVYWINDGLLVEKGSIVLIDSEYEINMIVEDDEKSWYRLNCYELFKTKESAIKDKIFRFKGKIVFLEQQLERL